MSEKVGKGIKECICETGCAGNETLRGRCERLMHKGG
jgi:hypothetical protein